MFGFKKNQQNNENKSKLIVRREADDRRSFKPASEFPITDSQGKLVKKDRRIQPDRRISNIEVSHNPFNVRNKTLKQ